MDRNDSWPAVSQICNLICLSAMEIMRAPNSTPIVRSWTGWKRLSVNWSRRHDLPTPEVCVKSFCCVIISCIQIFGYHGASERAVLRRNHVKIGSVYMNE